MDKLKEWYQKYGHGHCPEGCEHPQPFEHQDKIICGRCFCKYKEITEMEPCTPEICE